MIKVLSSFKNVQTLDLEMLKVVKNLPAPIVNETFEKRGNVYELRYSFVIVLPKIHSLFMLEQVFHALVLEYETWFLLK